MIQKAIEKLNLENKNFKGNRYADAMRTDVLETLIKFCRQDRNFATAVVLSIGTFSDCMTEVAKDVSKHISDLEAYRRAVKFYLPDADVCFEMEVTYNEGTQSAPKRRRFNTVSLD